MRYFGRPGIEGILASPTKVGAEWGCRLGLRSLGGGRRVLGVPLRAASPVVQWARGRNGRSRHVISRMPIGRSRRPNCRTIGLPPRPRESVAAQILLRQDYRPRSGGHAPSLVALQVPPDVRTDDKTQSGFVFLGLLYRRHGRRACPETLQEHKALAAMVGNGSRRGETSIGAWRVDTGRKPI